MAVDPLGAERISFLAAVILAPGALIPRIHAVFLKRAPASLVTAAVETPRAPVFPARAADFSLLQLVQQLLAAAQQRPQLMKIAPAAVKTLPDPVEILVQPV